MNFDKLKDRITTKPIKDIMGKDVYIGDIVVIPGGGKNLTKAMVFSISEKSDNYKLISSSGNVFNCKSECIKINDFYELSELKEWEDIKQKYISKKENDAANLVKQGVVLFLFYDKINNKPGITYSIVESVPGKNISSLNIKESIKWIENYKDIDFYIFTKNNDFIKNPKISDIFIGTSNTFYNEYIRVKNSTFKEKHFYYAHWVDRTWSEWNNIEDMQYIRTFINFTKLHANSKKIFFANTYKNDIYLNQITLYVPHIILKRYVYSSIDRTGIFADVLIDKISNYYVK